jgi:prepilin-type N-terminal cleavage/methylation domain-containing protein
MNKYLSREAGVTLVELLATLTILSLLVVLTYGVLMNGINYSKMSSENTSLQREANLLTNTITKLHETEISYEIILDTNPNATKISLNGKDSFGTLTRSFEFSDSKYEYSLYDYSSSVETPLTNLNTIKSSEPFYLKIVIRNKKDINQKYEVKTIISRL